MVDVFSATITWTWDQGDQGSEVEFLISSGTFFQSWLALINTRFINAYV